ncbi:hypothetical protein GCM10010289_29290 [Streptomyces violascens]|uniref:Uncharacterized protein n=1 Tax=Streptomyces violascens TaxID=67381 RepID=A0ABQ3QUB2_9ACTN|nr:hypothetical protein GCM10010289_29290 [Streptomyces violascens]GHI40869.1 hypothetical protein Sviol_52770 [Streptomyces violascens]
MANQDLPPTTILVRRARPVRDAGPTEDVPAGSWFPSPSGSADVIAAPLSARRG